MTTNLKVAAKLSFSHAQDSSF